MSTVNVLSSRDAAGAVNYVLFGNSRERRAELVEAGRTRAAAFTISVAGDHGASPAAFSERTEMMAAVHGRKVDLQSYVLAFAPDGFDVTDPNDLNNLTGKSLQRYTSWKHGLRQLNEDLMRDEGLRVHPEPEQPKPGWELRREAFTPGGFEQTLGDKV